jgi:hypothetical protein
VQQTGKILQIKWFLVPRSTFKGYKIETESQKVRKQEVRSYEAKSSKLKVKPTK